MGVCWIRTKLNMAAKQLYVYMCSEIWALVEMWLDYYDNISTAFANRSMCLWQNNVWPEKNWQMRTHVHVRMAGTLLKWGYCIEIDKEFDVEQTFDNVFFSFSFHWRLLPWAVSFRGYPIKCLYVTMAVANFCVLFSCFCDQIVRIKLRAGLSSNGGQHSAPYAKDSFREHSFTASFLSAICVCDDFFERHRPIKHIPMIICIILVV